jgi:deoxycytidylate deaminase
MVGGAADSARLSRQPELVFGLIGALGADVASVANEIRRELRDLGYRVGDDPVKLSAFMERLPGAPFDGLVVDGRRAGVEAYMDAGGYLRECLRPDALAMFAVSAMRFARKTEFGPTAEGPANGVAFILDSIKHHEEVQALRRLYGSAFIAVGVYTPYEKRLDAVIKRLRDHAGHGSRSDYEHEAERLIEKDRDEQDKPTGQHVSDAFALADVVVSTHGNSASSISRFIKLLFGDWTQTPMRDEVGMAHAQIAAYQSASMARQVGAALCRRDGSLVATGTNDVPKFGGGLYDADDLCDKKPDVRDFSAFGYDTSDDQRRELLEDVLCRLIQSDLITSVSEAQVREIAIAMLRDRGGIMRRAKFMATIDYIRAMHAEAAALSNAARHGIATEGCTLYVTTFPCHDCAKQIIADGLRRIVYVEPYTKSLAQKFYGQQINVDGANVSSETVSFEPFVGVAPRRYRELFSMTDARKDLTGTFRAWNKTTAVPRLPETQAGLAARRAGEKTN